ncbi:MAG: hypothetical protein NTZ78_00690 [Candidatus Aureabacteria bacterium]|nr:hypothetical protein [Candidatus Auribacterota bacterium]
MRKYFYLALLLSFVPSMSLAAIYSIGVWTGLERTLYLTKDIGDKTIYANVVPWGLRMTIGGGGDTLGTEWLWLAIQKWPDEKIMFLRPDGRLSEKPFPFGPVMGGFLEEFTFETPELEITPAISEGLYLVYALSTWSPSSVYNKSLWDGEVAETFIFIRRELNCQEWESQGWTIIDGPDH